MLGALLIDRNCGEGLQKYSKFNQGIWLDLEFYTGAVANKFGSVWIIAGPIFIKGVQIQYIGDPGEAPVAIPHFMFKIIAKESNTSSNEPDVLAFVYPQYEPIRYKKGRCSTDKTYDHEFFLTSIKAIEDLTGLEFFNNLTLNEPEGDKFKERIATHLWQIEDKYWGMTCNK